MTVKEEIVRKVQSMPEDEARALLRYIDEQLGPRPSPLRAFGSFLDEIAANAPSEDIEKIPIDASEHLDSYLYGHPAPDLTPGTK